MAATFLNEVIKQVGDGVPIEIENLQIKIPKENIFEWMIFSAENSSISYSFNSEKMLQWFTEKYGDKIAIPAGVTKVTIRDFEVVSEDTGVVGKTLNVESTIASIENYLNGRVARAKAITTTISPTIDYSKTYSEADSELESLMKDFAKTHNGAYGISLIELSGERRHASYNGDTQFITASTYKLFIAYSALLRIENGEWKWSDKITKNRNTVQCFEDIIALSDNECAEVFLYKIGFKALTDEAHAIGATNTSFMGSDAIKSTANDEALLLALLASGQILKQQASRDIFISAMERNIYKQGISAGLPSATVASKVGFLDGLLHDASIIYSSSGTYVLVIMTEGSSWGNIANLSSQIESLRIGSL